MSYVTFVFTSTCFFFGLEIAMIYSRYVTIYNLNRKQVGKIEIVETKIALKEYRMANSILERETIKNTQYSG